MEDHHRHIEEPQVAVPQLGGEPLLLGVPLLLGELVVAAVGEDLFHHMILDMVPK